MCISLSKIPDNKHNLAFQYQVTGIMSRNPIIPYMLESYIKVNSTHIAKTQLLASLVLN